MKNHNDFECYGDYPQNHQDMAERDCFNCVFQEECSMAKCLAIRCEPKPNLFKKLFEYIQNFHKLMRCDTI